MANLSNINGKFVVEQTTGYVGVGTTDPSYPIEVLNASAEIALNASGGSIYRLRSDNTDSFRINKNGVGDRLVIDGSGNSTFAGNITANNVTLDNILLTTATLPAINTPSISLRNTNNEIYFQAGSANVFNFMKADYTTMLALDGINSAAFSADVLAPRFNVGTTSTSIIQETNRMKFTNAIANDAGGFDFYTRTTGSVYINALQILGNGNSTFAGNVNIGTALITPNTNFDNLVISQNGNSGITILSNSANDGGIYFGDENSNNRGQIKYLHASNSMTFTTDDVQRLTIDSSGNSTFTGGTIIKGNGVVYLGYTDATAIGGNKLEVNGNIYSSGNATFGGTITTTAATSGLYIGSSRIFLSSTGDLAISSIGGDLDITTWLRIRSGDAGTIRFAVSSVQGSTHIGGDADQNYALKSSLTLKSYFAGNVGIGVTGPGSKLDVNGTIRISTSGRVEGRSYPYTTNLGSGADATTTYLIAGSTASTVTSIDLAGASAANPKTIIFKTASTERMRITSGGVVQVGTTPGVTPAILTARKNGTCIEFGHGNNTGRYEGTLGVFGSSGNSYIGFATSCDNSANTFTTRGAIGNVITGDNSGNLNFQQATNANASGQTLTQRMRISNVGRVTINTTIVTDARCTIAGDSSHYALNLYADVLYSSVYRYQRFRSGGNIAGGIEGSNQTSVVYNTSSDYRMKKNIKPLENGLERLSKLKPVKFDWKLNDESTEGFIAHEVQEIFPDAISGEKDGEDMQGMDYGRITPLLVAAIQELKAEIEILKNK